MIYCEKTILLIKGVMYVICILFMCISFMVYKIHKDKKTILLQDRHIQALQAALSYISTIEEFQKRIGVEPDGKLGPQWYDSKTQKAWVKL